MYPCRGMWVVRCAPPPQDPLADGPVIQNAATRALEKHTTLDKVIDMVRRTAPAMKAPLVMFTYYNPIMRKGLDNFCKTVKEAGAAGAQLANCREQQRQQQDQVSPPPAPKFQQVELWLRPSDRRVLATQATAPWAPALPFPALLPAPNLRALDPRSPSRARRLTAPTRVPAYP